MGIRTLIEINHDNTGTLIDQDPTGFIQDIQQLIRSVDHKTIDNLYHKFEAKVIATRHSSDKYYISFSEPGFPPNLPYEEFDQHRELALEIAKEITGGTSKPRTNRQLENVVKVLVGVIEHQKDLLDDN